MALTGATSVAISVTDVGKTFASDHGPVEALRGIDLDIEHGEFVVLLGPSGCGKTTLLRIIGNLSEPTSGRVTLAGADGSARAATDIGFVFQEPNLMPWRRVLANVALPLELRRRSKKERVTRARELLDLVGLSDFERAYPRQLSGGMRQRVAIARALAHDPAVLLMDEPFGALDAQSRDQMNVELQRIWMESAKTSVLVTHSIPEAVFLADRVILLSRHPGQIVDIRRVEFERPRQLSLLEEIEFMRIVADLRGKLDG